MDILQSSRRLCGTADILSVTIMMRSAMLLTTTIPRCSRDETILNDATEVRCERSNINDTVKVSDKHNVWLHRRHEICTHGTTNSAAFLTLVFGPDACPMRRADLDATLPVDARSARGDRRAVVPMRVWPPALRDVSRNMPVKCLKKH